MSLLQKHFNTQLIIIFMNLPTASGKLKRAASRTKRDIFSCKINKGRLFHLLTQWAEIQTWLSFISILHRFQRVDMRSYISSKRYKRSQSETYQSINNQYRRPDYWSPQNNHHVPPRNIMSASSPAIIIYTSDHFQLDKSNRNSPAGCSENTFTSSNLSIFTWMRIRGYKRWSRARRRSGHLFKSRWWLLESKILYSKDVFIRAKPIVWMIRTSGLLSGRGCLSRQPLHLMWNVM